VRNQLIIVALAAALLAGCSSSNDIPNSGSTQQQLSRIAQVPVHGASTKRVAILSVFGSLTINGAIFKEVVNGNCTLYDKRHRRAVGCRVFSAVNARVTRSSFTFFTGASGTGCSAATGHFRGRIFRGSSIPIAFRWSGLC
jgi:hypothetical protein